MPARAALPYGLKIGVGGSPAPRRICIWARLGRGFHKSPFKKGHRRDSGELITRNPEKGARDGFTVGPRRTLGGGGAVDPEDRALLPPGRRRVTDRQALTGILIVLETASPGTLLPNGDFRSWGQGGPDGEHPLSKGIPGLMGTAGFEPATSRV